MIASKAARYPRCHGRKYQLWCWHWFQKRRWTTSVGSGVFESITPNCRQTTGCIPCIAARNPQLVGSVSGRDWSVCTALAYHRSVSFHPAPRLRTSLRTRAIRNPPSGGCDASGCTDEPTSEQPCRCRGRQSTPHHPSDEGCLYIL